MLLASNTQPKNEISLFLCSMMLSIILIYHHILTLSPLVNLFLLFPILNLIIFIAALNNVTSLLDFICFFPPNEMTLHC